MADEEDWPPACPKCRSKDVKHEDMSEYTGGGYADQWTEFECNQCGWAWRSKTTTGYM